MFLYIVKVIGMFLIAITVLRLMGKSVLAQVTPHDLIAIVMIAALATKPLLDESIMKTLVGIAVLLTVQIGFSRLTLVKWGNKFILGKPTILVKHGKIVKDNLQRSKISLAELLTYIRAKGYPDVREVLYAILEPTGTISVLPFEDLYPVTPRDLRIDKSYRGIALPLVIDGHIQYHNLALIGKDEHWLTDELTTQGYRDLRRVMYAAKMEDERHLYIDDGEGGEGDGL